MLWLNASELSRALPMAEAIEAAREAFLALAEGRAQVPERAQLTHDAPGALSLVMPAHVARSATSPETTSVKVVSVVPKNLERGRARIQGTVLLLDSESGELCALIDGARLTALRTGAASGLATDLLARKDAAVLAVFGAGVQAETQVEAVACVRRLESVRVFAPTSAHAQELLERVAAHPDAPTDLRVSSSPREALADADLVCTASTSQTPVFSDEDLQPGAHVNAVGSFQPEVVEIPFETTARAYLVVDSRKAALAETGDLIQALRQGKIVPEHLQAELGELLAGRASGRSHPEQITLFKSVGLAVQDACAARRAVAKALRDGLGRRFGGLEGD